MWKCKHRAIWSHLSQRELLEISYNEIIIFNALLEWEKQKTKTKHKIKQNKYDVVLFLAFPGGYCSVNYI